MLGNLDPVLALSLGIFFLIFFSPLIAWRRAARRAGKQSRMVAELTRNISDSERARATATQRSEELEERYAGLTSIEAEITRLQGERDRVQRESEAIREKYLGRKDHLDALER